MIFFFIRKMNYCFSLVVMKSIFILVLKKYVKFIIEREIGNKLELNDLILKIWGKNVWLENDVIFK